VPLGPVCRRRRRRQTQQQGVAVARRHGRGVASAPGRCLWTARRRRGCLLGLARTLPYQGRRRCTLHSPPWPRWHEARSWRQQQQRQRRL